MQLFNKINGKRLKSEMKISIRKRITISFYRYYRIGNPHIFRDHLYLLLNDLGVLGRIYVASEGINAQISLPEDNFEALMTRLAGIEFLKGIRLNPAFEDNGKSFFKLKIKIRPKILADGLQDESFDVTRVGIHLQAAEFNELAKKENTIIVDMRNHYETEIGHFRNALRPDADTFREALAMVGRQLEPHKKKQIIMYCTGGIRCEKASAYLRHTGFENVYQLEGGIIKYARDVAESGIENRFIGKNFVFDERLGERISDDIIAHCHQCGKPNDSHTNCKNTACNLLFIQCESCSQKYEGCCSLECREIFHLPEEEQRKLRKGNDQGIRIFSKGRFSRKGHGIMNYD
ncbi:MAG: rhodanese-related sulfurtransferase [Cyclobacteriaceae bacterium]|nr:rhodanese-related sulfurtransferase [Cyclobacteriaceae bacterium]